MKNWTLWVAVITALVFIACGGGAGSGGGDGSSTHNNNDPWSINIVGEPTPSNGSVIQEGDSLLYTIDYTSGDVPSTRHAGVAIVAETNDPELPIVLIASEEIAPNSKGETTLSGSVDLDKLQGAVYPYQFVAVIVVSTNADLMNSGDWDIQKRSPPLTYYAGVMDSDVSSIIQIASDGERLYTLSPVGDTGGRLKVWNVDDNGVSISGSSIELDFNPTCLAQDGDFLYIGGVSGTEDNATWEIRTYNKESLELESTWEDMPSGSVTAIEILGDFAYVAGSYNGDGRVEARSTETGQVSLSKDLTGFEILDLAVHFETGMDLPVAVYLVGREDSQWTVHKLKATWDDPKEEGIFPVHVNTAALATHVAVDFSGVCIFGTDNDGQLRLERRNPSGGLVYAVVTDPLPDISSTPGGLVLDGDSLYLAGSTTEPSDNTKLWVQKRNLADGVPDTSFGTEGTFWDDPSDFQDMALCLALGENSLYVGGVTNQSQGQGGQGYLLALNK